jgi:arylsulfatase A-like enzyme
MSRFGNGSRHLNSREGVRRRRLLKLLAALPASLALAAAARQSEPSPAMAIGDAQTDNGLSAHGYGQSSTREREQAQPNLLLITVDSLRADHIGAYGYRHGSTPNLDRLAAEGVLVNSAYSVMPSTNPAHAALLTGTHPARNGVFVHMVERLAADVPTLAEVLVESGYATAGIFSWHSLEPRFSGLERGFEVYRGAVVDREAYEEQQHSSMIPVDERLDRLTYDLSNLDEEVALSEYAEDLLEGKADITTDAALRWLERERQPDRPFFLWVHYFDPHYPYTAPPHDGPNAALLTQIKAAGGDSLHRPEQAVGDLVEAFALGHGQGGSCEMCPTGDMATVRRIIAEVRPNFHPDEVAHLRWLYDREIAFVDQQVGRLLGALSERGPERETAVVVTADHGESFGQHGLWLHGSGLYSDEIRIPLLMHYPDHLPRGRTIAGPASLVDIMPTLLELANLPIPDSVQGANLLPLLSGAEPDGQRRAFSVASEPAVSIATRNWRLIHHLLDDRVELYSVDADPGELENLAPPPPSAHADGLAEEAANEADNAEEPLPIASLAADVIDHLQPPLSGDSQHGPDAFAYAPVVDELLAELRAWQATAVASSARLSVQQFTRQGAE